MRKGLRKRGHDDDQMKRSLTMSSRGRPGLSATPKGLTCFRSTESRAVPVGRFRR